MKLYCDVLGNIRMFTSLKSVNQVINHFFFSTRCDCRDKISGLHHRLRGIELEVGFSSNNPLVSSRCFRFKRSSCRLAAMQHRFNVQYISKINQHFEIFY